jgi:hypothetical protein
MFSAMLLAISIAALMQFAAYYWRSILAGVAAQPISAEVLSAVSVDHGMLNGRDFQVVAKLYELTPNLQKKSSGIGLVSAYFQVIHTRTPALRALRRGASRSPAAIEPGSRRRYPLLLVFPITFTPGKVRLRAEFGIGTIQRRKAGT